MPISCITLTNAEKLKAAARRGEISMQKLLSMTSEQRRTLFAKYLDEASAKNVNALLEKAIISPNQKLAVKNWIWKNMYDGKPLYKELSLEQSKKMFNDGLKVKDLKAMSSDQRINKLTEYTDQKTAEILNKRFEIAEKSNNLENWEQRVLGSKELYQDKKLNEAFSRLKALDSLGILSPNQMENFMGDYVAMKLGVDITAEESLKLSGLIKSQDQAYNQLLESGDWTANNNKMVEDFFSKKTELEKYTETLAKMDIIDTANDLVEIARNNILGSIRILRNSALYQVIPSIERWLTKRLVSANIGADASLTEKISAKIAAGLIPDKEGADFIKRQLAMSLRIYHKTGYDISRMVTLEDGFRYFGEAERRMSKVSLKEAKGVKEKMQAGIRNFAVATGVFPKWMAGGTDSFIANTTRAETAVLWSREMARLEAKKGQLPTGVTEKQRANQLLTESYSFNPQDPKAQIIRSLGIADAHHSNNTQPDGMSDAIIKARKSLRIGQFRFGKALVPFAKISTATISRGLQTAVPIGTGKALYGLAKAATIEDPVKRAEVMSRFLALLYGYLGLTGTAILLALMLDEDDYIAPYEALSYGEYGLARARNASPGSVRIAGRWIPLRYLPMVSIPLSAIMNGRRMKSKGKSALFGYFMGIWSQLLDTPVIKELKDLSKKTVRTFYAKDFNEFANSMGVEESKTWDWFKVRAIPSMLSYDLYNAILPDAKYNFMGEEIARGGVFRKDNQNAIIIEFNKLEKEGFLPILSDPRTEDAERVKEKLGEELYEKKLNELKREYAQAVERMIMANYYNNWTPEKKKEKIDSLRKKYITDKLKKL